jgi:BlaI family penicillinase repressor
MEAKDLTKAEEQLMQALWKMQRAFIREIIDQMPEPKPVHSSVSTIMRVLETKGLVGYDAFGKSHRYYPLISREEYKRFQLMKLMVNYFDNSAQKLFSFFIDEQKIPEEDVKEINKMLLTLKDQQSGK